MNLFDFPEFTNNQSEEITEILKSESIRIEKIVSRNAKSEKNFWYDQKENEWLTILEGWGELEFEDGSFKKLEKGDSLMIPAHEKHRVNATSDECIWLAVFWVGSGKQEA